METLNKLTYQAGVTTHEDVLNNINSNADSANTNFDFLEKNKQNNLTFDNTPTDGSNNPVTSGGVKSYVDEKTKTINDLIAEGYMFAGIATPTTDPGKPDGNVFYLASESGTYSNFGGAILTTQDVAILYYDGSKWNCKLTGIANDNSVSLFENAYVDGNDIEKSRIAKIRDIIKSVRVLGVPPSMRLYVWNISKPGYEVYNNVITLITTDGEKNTVVCNITTEYYGQNYIRKNISNKGYIELLVDWDKLDEDRIAFSRALYPISLRYYYKEEEYPEPEPTIPEDYLLESENLLNKDSLSIGFLNPDTGLTNSSMQEYRTTDYLTGYNGYTYLMTSNHSPLRKQIRSFCVYNAQKEFIFGKEKDDYGTYSEWLNSVEIRDLEDAIFVRICFSINIIDLDTAKLYCLKTYKSLSYYPQLYTPSEKIFNPNKLYLQSNLSGKDLFVFGDSKSARKISWATVFSTINCIRHHYNLAVGGSAIINSSYTSGSINGEVELVNGQTPKHVISQVINCAKTIIENYNYGYDYYKQEDGNYIISPDIVVFSFGYNDVFGNLKTSTINDEIYSSVASQTFEELKQYDYNLTNGKYYANYRYCIELLKTSVITYLNLTVDCRKSKFYILCPIQAAKDKPDNSESGIGLKDMYSILKPLADDYSIELINCYTDSGICGRFEVSGGAGVWLGDGVHPNPEGYERIARLVSGRINANFWYTINE